ncbi:hypothetical protein N7516_007472 [Penicillium verrucosum]|uniref:uncharacterized protein n=1 Tax=Penicillium verrucosum TaxID=60171 RepID=UPI0025459523|nr:uncharacterized protein N7516_007472 [Penicillium verrucosum]KAJ5932983.1 hypothetical protein N7516_007472 [Penicillium verrucosum]
MIAIGMEGSANKVASSYTPQMVLANVRHTYNAPPGEGFLPKDTVVKMVKAALQEASLSPQDVDCICFTKGPGMGAPLQSIAIAARMMSLLWDKPLIAVNHCVGLKGMDCSFSGTLGTIDALAVSLGLNKAEQTDQNPGDQPTWADLYFSLQETVYAILVEITERAMAHIGSK